MLVLQKFHDLRDMECEFQIRDRFSFISFLRWHHRDPIPNAQTIWDFKQALEKDAGMATGGCSTGLKKPSPKVGGSGEKETSRMRVLWRCRANATTGAKVHDPQVSKKMENEK